MSPSLRWRKRSTAAAVFSEVTVTIASSTSAQVSWFVSPNAQGQVQYGTSPGVYTGATTLETGYLGYHSQTISGLSAGTPVFARVMAITPGPVITYTDEFTFTTEAAPSGAFDAGMTYTSNVAWPTGTGWTAGALSTINSNVNGLIASSGNGADATHHVRHLPAPGAEYPTNAYYNLAGRQHITFELGGTEVSGEPWGHTGGAILSTTANNASSGGDTSRQAVFTAGTGAAGSATFDDIRWHAGTLKGSGINLASSSAGSGNGTEYQFGIGSFGGDNGLVDHMILTDFSGDCIEFQQSTGTNGVASHQSTNWEVRYTQMRRVNRMTLAGQAGKNINIHHCYFADPAYSYIDIEPDAAYHANENWTIDDCVFAGQWNWMQSGGPAGLGFAMPAITLTVPGSAQPSFNGFFRARNNRMDGTLASPNYVSDSRKFITLNAFTRVNVNGEVTITGNTRTSARQNGPIVTINWANTGPITVTGNTGWKTASGAWLSSANSTSVTQSGND